MVWGQGKFWTDGFYLVYLGLQSPHLGAPAKQSASQT
jgi:hypothetical protein